MADESANLPQAPGEPHLVFRVHAVQQMFKRSVSEVDVRAVLDDGEVIEERPADMPFPAKLTLGWIDIGGTEIPLHVATSFDDQSNTLFVLTVYEPDQRLWDNGFRRRKKP